MNEASENRVAGDEIFTLRRGSTPLLVSLPHVGTRIPEELHGRYVPRASPWKTPTGTSTGSTPSSRPWGRA